MNKPTSEISFIDLLQLLFIYLKLHGDIDWPWWCIMLPFISFLLLVIIKAGGSR